MSQDSGGVQRAVRVIPNAPRSEISGIRDGEALIRIQAPAVDGKANEALVDFLAKALDCRKSEISILRGGNARRKLLSLTLRASEALDRILGEA